MIYNYVWQSRFDHKKGLRNYLRNITCPDGIPVILYLFEHFAAKCASVISTCQGLKVSLNYKECIINVRALQCLSFFLLLTQNYTREKMEDVFHLFIHGVND